MDREYSIAAWSKQHIYSFVFFYGGNSPVEMVEEFTVDMEKELTQE